MVVPVSAGWQPPVRTCSAVQDEGLDKIWSDIETFAGAAKKSGGFADRRKQQKVRWMWDQVEERLQSDLDNAEALVELRDELEAELIDGRTTPSLAAERLLGVFYKSRN